MARGRRERRATFRVRVEASSGLEATLRVLDREWPVEVSNISAEGVFIRLPPEALTELELDALVEFELLFSGERLLLSGLVRSRRRSGCGIYFPRQDAEGYRNPLDRLSRVVMRLQLRRLARRRKQRIFHRS